MRRVFINLLVMAVLIGAAYILMTNSLHSNDSFNKSQQPTRENSINPDDSTRDDSAEEEIAKDTELYKTIAVDGKGILTPGISREIISSTFWTGEYKKEEVPIMTPDRIAQFNKDIINKVPVVYDLVNYKDKLSGDELSGYIKHYKLPSGTMYDYNGKAIQQNVYNSLIANTNLPAIKALNPVRYGITVKKTSIRSFPTEISAYNSSTNRTLDRFQETGCEPCEPVIILHVSKDSKWYFVQIYNYRGWLKSDSVALSDKKNIFDYTGTDNFLMVTGQSIPVEPVDSNASIPKEFKMGTKLFLVQQDKDTSSYYKVKLPVRKDDGSLDFTSALVPNNQDVSEGYLPYTRYNLITQAFKLQGIPYDWGDKYSGRDCSSFIMYVFRTFGINLPRNTDEQEICSANTLKFKAQDTIQTRLKALDKLKPGAALYMPGHVMFFLGKMDNQYYIIHAFLGYSTKEGSSNKYQSTNQVAVTTVQLANSEGIPFIQKLTSAVQFEY